MSDELYCLVESVEPDSLHCSTHGTTFKRAGIVPTSCDNTWITHKRLAATLARAAAVAPLSAAPSPPSAPPADECSNCERPFVGYHRLVDGVWMCNDADSYYADQSYKLVAVAPPETTPPDLYAPDQTQIVPASLSLATPEPQRDGLLTTINRVVAKRERATPETTEPTATVNPHGNHTGICLCKHRITQHGKRGDGCDVVGCSCYNYTDEGYRASALCHCGMSLGHHGLHAVSPVASPSTPGAEPPCKSCGQHVPVGLLGYCSSSCYYNAQLAASQQEVARLLTAIGEYVTARERAGMFAGSSNAEARGTRVIVSAAFDRLRSITSEPR